MSTSCTTFATSTETDVITTNSISTSFSDVVTSFSGTPSVVVVSSCAAFTTSNSSSSCLSSTTSSSTTIVGGGVSTIEVPVTITTPVVQTEFNTLYGSSCTVIGKPGTPTPFPSPTVVTTTSTPPPMTLTSTIPTTLPNGGVTVQVVTITSTQPPSPVVISASASSTTPVASSGTNIAPIVGGVVAGVGGLCAIVFIVWFIMKRRRRWDDIFDSEIDAAMAAAGRGPGLGGNRFSSMATTDIEPEPKPYEYGYVGNTVPLSQHSPAQTPPISASSRSSTVLSISQMNNTGNNGLPPSAFLQTPPGTYPQQFNNGARPMSINSVSSGGFAPIPPPGVSSPPQAQGSWSGPGPGPSPAFAAIGSPGHSSSGSNTGEDYFDRSIGSPVSFTNDTNGRKLQVTNGQRMSIMTPHSDLLSNEGTILEEDYGDSSVASVSVQPDRKNSKSRPKSSRNSVSVGTPSASTSGGGSSGKPAPVVLVHTDGGGSASESNAPPPAYEE